MKGRGDTQSDLGGFRGGGALAEEVDLLADFLGHAGVGELGDDALAEADGFGPGVVLDGGGELLAEEHELVLEDAAGGVLHGFGLGGGEVDVELLEDLDAAIDVVAGDGVVPGIEELLFEGLSAVFDVLGDALNLRVVGEGGDEAVGFAEGEGPLLPAAELVDEGEGVGDLAAHVGVSLDGDFLADAVGLLFVAEDGFHFVGEHEGGIPVFPGCLLGDGAAKGFAFALTEGDGLGTLADELLFADLGEDGGQRADLLADGVEDSFLSGGGLLA